MGLLIKELDNNSGAIKNSLEEWVQQRKRASERESLETRERHSQAERVQNSVAGSSAMLAFRHQQ